MTKMNRQAIITLMLAGALCAPAASLTPDEALSAALGNGLSRIKGMDGKASYSHVWTAESGGLYAFNNEKGGFVITAADDSMPELLIGYSDSGFFDAADIPPAMHSMLLHFASGNYTASPVAAPARENVEPLVAAQWDQDAPFNNLCPVTSEGKKTMAGCMAISMAQVVNKWKHPLCGTGTVSVDFEGEVLSLDLSECPFDWDNIYDVYSDGEYSDRSAMAVANLVRAVGYTCEMDYSPFSSGADLRTAALGMVEHLGYDRSLRSLRKSFFSTGRWISLLYEELAAGRPVMYNGYGETGGHAFVCDGYDGSQGDYFHINWGWSGVSNGYFLLGNLSPAETGIGGGSGTYNNNQEAFIGIQPDKGTENFTPFMCVYGGFGVSSASYSRSKTPEFTTISDGADGSSGITGGARYRGFYNLGLVPEDVTFGIKLVDNESGEVMHIASATPSKMAVNQRIQSFKVNGADFPSGEGSYTVTPAIFRDGAWIDVEQEQATLTQVTLSTTDTKLKFSVENASPALNVSEVMLSEVVNGEPVHLSARFTAQNGDFSGNVIPVLCTDRTILSHMPPRSLQLLSGESGMLEWNDKFDVSLTPGSYEFLIVKQEGYKIVYDGGNIEVLERSSVGVVEPDADGSAIRYGLDGTRVSGQEPGSLYIERTPDGKARVRYHR